MTDDEKFLDELSERSKNDRAIIVGSEVRRLIVMVREREKELNRWFQLDINTQARISQLESALREASKVIDLAAAQAILTPEVKALSYLARAAREKIKEVLNA